MKKIVFVFASVLVLVACKKKDDKGETPSTTDPYATQKTELKTTYADLAFAVYDDALVSAQELNTALIAFVDNPTATTQLNAKQAWFDAREVYGQSEIFRFVDGPIDNTSDGPEGLINAWPMDEAYIDYVVGNTTSGIINNVVTYPSITLEVIVGANEFGGESNISAGYHAIEFLLWGQDLDDNGPGSRPYTDFVTGGGSASNETRRGTYLKHLGNLLVTALQQVRDAWNPAGVSNYRQTFLAMDNNTALRKMFNSLRVLSGEELAGERISVAYDNADQEDEHSCFSDNTHRDIALNAQAISNLYTGTYVRMNGTTVTGYSLEDLVAEVSPAKNTEIMARFTTTAGYINTMHIPFDRAIVEAVYRPGVLSVIESLQAEQTLFTAIAADFDIVF